MKNDFKEIDSEYIDKLCHKADPNDPYSTAVKCEWDYDKHDKPCPFHDTDSGYTVKFTHESTRKAEEKESKKKENDALSELRKETATLKALNENTEAKKKFEELHKEKSVDTGKTITEVGTGLSKIGSQMPSKAGKSVYKKYDELNDEELRKKVDRIRKEHELSDLQGDTKYVKSGEDKAREAIQSFGALLSIVGTVVGIVAAVKGLKGNKPTAK